MRRESALKYFDKHKDFMQTVVETNIERNRKGNGKIIITEGNGKPLKNVKIKIKQKSHEFKFGANIFMLDELETEDKNKKYKQAFKQLYNLATIPFYWSDLEPEQGKPRYAKDSPKIYRRPATDLCVEYCLENGIEPKCHCLNYDNFTPAWLKDADVATHKKALDKRIRELAERYAGVIPSWEVTNETFYADAENRTMSKFYYEDDFVEWSFKTADRYLSNNHLIINDYCIFDPYVKNRSSYFMQIERLLRNPACHLDSIGFQFHSFFPKEMEKVQAYKLYNPVRLYEIMDKYATLGKNLQITEMTIPAYSDSQEDQEVQAELLEKLYTVFFSHPAMEAVIYWNLVDGYAAFAPQGDMTAGENVYYGGLMNFDLSKKKSFEVLEDLLTKKWHTELIVTTSDDGIAEFRGFYGDYLLEIEDGEKTTCKEISLLKKKNNVTNIIL